MPKKSLFLFDHHIVIGCYQPEKIKRLGVWVHKEKCSYTHIAHNILIDSLKRVKKDIKQSISTPPVISHTQNTLAVPHLLQALAAPD